jgi:DNA-binding PadR family transcriptional regulator
MRIADLEGHQYVLQMLVNLRQNTGSYVAEMTKDWFGGTSAPTVYRVIHRLEGLGLIRNELLDDKTWHGIKRMYYLTPEGEKVADHLLEIEKALRGSGKK